MRKFMDLLYMANGFTLLYLAHCWIHIGYGLNPWIAIPAGITCLIAPIVLYWPLKAYKK